MLDEKKMEEAASTYGASNNCQIIGRNWKMSLKPELKNAFSEGAHWAIQEFLKDLWHPAGEEPEGYEQWILVQYKYGGFSSVFQIKEIKFWKHFVEKISIKHWCYIDDLLEQKGGEK